MSYFMLLFYLVIAKRQVHFNSNGICWLRIEADFFGKASISGDIPHKFSQMMTIIRRAAPKSLKQHYAPKLSSLFLFGKFKSHNFDSYCFTSNLTIFYVHFLFGIFVRPRILMGEGWHGAEGLLFKLWGCIMPSVLRSPHVTI
jgi:hypothetical protein